LVELFFFLLSSSCFLTSVKSSPSESVAELPSWMC
jgi:hypothetical protein